MGGNNEDQDPKDLGPYEALIPIQSERSLGNDTLPGESADYNMVKLLQMINKRAVNFSMDCELPKMNLSALYCLGVTIQEYSRYLATDILTEKRAADGLEPLLSLFSQEEINEQQIDSIIERCQPDNSIPAVVDEPPAKEKLTNLTGPYSFRNNHKFNVATSVNKSYFDKMLTSSDWRSTLKKKKRNPEAEEAAAKKRRESNRLLAQKIAAERVLRAEEQKLKMLQNANNNHQYQPQLEPVAKRKIKVEREDAADIFDTSKKKTIKPKAKMKKKSVNPF